jgi:undecaprenyl phosphate N,N'-diacetylbacillosamine 1-phosphate transferase
MRVNAPLRMDAEGSAWVGDDDDRVTRIGAFLRRTSIDEVPQLINILKGDMSFIGPRPDLAEEVALYSGDEFHRLDVRPGLGGYAQVNGRNSISIAERHELDLEYVRRISFKLDCSIFGKSITTALSKEDINNG